MSFAPITLGRTVRKVATPSFVFTETAHRAGAVLEPHAHERAAISYVAEGRRTYLFGTRCVEAVSGAVVFVPAGEQHASRVGGADGHGLMVEVAAFDQACAPHRALDISLTRLCDSILFELRRSDALTPLALESLAAELLDRDGRDRERCAPAWLECVREALHDEPLDALSLDALAQAAGVGRSRLTRAFRRTFRTSIGAYVREIRVRRAWRLISCSDMPLAEVAASCGFADQSHLTRTFRTAFAASPGELRRNAPRSFKTPPHGRG